MTAPRTALAIGLALALVAACRPARPAPMHPETPAGRWHLVAAGDTLASLAAQAGVPAEDILEVNGLDRADQIRPGKLIFVLAGESGPATVTTTAPALAGVTAALRWPLDPERIVVASPFGVRDGRPHEGIDLPAPPGTPVYAAADGVVVYAGAAIRGYGNMIVLRHGGDRSGKGPSQGPLEPQPTSAAGQSPSALTLLTVYAHNSALLAHEGQEVRAGDRIALVGQSGRATGPHLHFEVRRGQIPQDPLSFLPRQQVAPGAP